MESLFLEAHVVTETNHIKLTVFIGLLSARTHVYVRVHVCLSNCVSFMITAH